jgi:hypothetical protein
MAEAVFGLMGVVVGGLLTGVVAFYLERRREKQEAQVARSIARSELVEAARAIEDALAGDEWPPGWDKMRWSESWLTNRRVLAATMEEGGFAKLARAYLDMQLLQTGLSAGRRKFVEQDKTFLTTAKSHLSEARPFLLAKSNAP